MYKKFSLTELSNIQNNLIPNFYKIIKNEKCEGANDFFKVIFREGNEVFFFERGDICFKVAQDETFLTLSDEKEKIQIQVPIEEKSSIQNLVKKYVTKKERQIGQKSIEQILMEGFKTGAYTHIIDKPYLVYDIETTMAVDDLKQVKFIIGYAMQPQEDNTMSYECIFMEDLPKFVEKMLNFDGYIIGFNQVWFDNPVCIYNVGGTEEDIKKLNEKSLDLFLFVQNMTGKRIGLNKISDALVGTTKTLESGAQVESMRKQYKESGDEKILKEIQNYCKNDVRMTALVLLYMLHFKKLYIEGSEHHYTVDEFVQNSFHKSVQKSENNTIESSLFS